MGRHDPNEGLHGKERNPRKLPKGVKAIPPKPQKAGRHPYPQNAEEALTHRIGGPPGTKSAQRKTDHGPVKHEAAKAKKGCCAAVVIGGLLSSAILEELGRWISGQVQ